MIATLRQSRILLTMILLGAMVMSLSIPVSAQSASPDTNTLDPAPIVEWTELLRQSIQLEKTTAPAAARIYGYTGITIYESLAPGMPNNRSLAFQVNELPELPFWTPSLTYDWLSSADGAISTVLKGLMFDASEETLASFDDLRQAHAEARTAEVGADVVERSLAFGDEVGVALLNWISSDGFKATRTNAVNFVLPTAADYSLSPESNYLYVQTDPDESVVEPFFGQVRTLGVQDRYYCIESNNVTFSTDPDSTYYQQADEVYQTVNDLTPQQREIAEFWQDAPGESSTTAGHWVSITSQMVEHLDLPLDRAAMVFGMLGMVLEDSYITEFGSKYETLTLRPETYINEYIGADWTTAIEAQQSPEYPADNAVVSAAAADMLTNLLGVVSFTDLTYDASLHVRRSYKSFEEAADEAAISQLYGGTQYRTSIENGKRVGRCVTSNTLDRIVMLPLAQGE